MAEFSIINSICLKYHGISLKSFIFSLKKQNKKQQPTTNFSFFLVFHLFFLSSYHALNFFCNLESYFFNLTKSKILN